jgi:hypothetical protein
LFSLHLHILASSESNRGALVWKLAEAVARQHALHGRIAADASADEDGAVDNGMSARGVFKAIVAAVRAPRASPEAGAGDAASSSASVSASSSSSSSSFGRVAVRSELLQMFLSLPATTEKSAGGAGAGAGAAVSGGAGAGGAYSRSQFSPVGVSLIVALLRFPLSECASLLERCAIGNVSNLRILFVAFRLETGSFS